MRVLRVELVEDVARSIQVAVRHQLVPDLRRLVLAYLSLGPIVGAPHKLGEGDFLDLTEANAEIFLEFSLQSPRKLFIGFVGDDSEPVDGLVVDALTAL